MQRVQSAFISTCKEEGREGLVDGNPEKLVFASLTSFPLAHLALLLGPIILPPGLRREDEFVGIK